MRITHSDVYQPAISLPRRINDGFDPGAESAVRVVITFVFIPQVKHFMFDDSEAGEG